MENPISYKYQGFNNIKGTVNVIETLTKKRFSIPYEKFKNHPAYLDLTAEESFEIGQQIGIFESKLGFKFKASQNPVNTKTGGIYNFLVALYSIFFFLSNITASKARLSH